MDEHFVRVQTALAGRYSLERELGRGGMGVVYLAHEVALDRPVALKLLPPELTTDDAVRERFLREARTAAKLSHPHIVPIYAVDETDDLVFFAMAAIDGETLGERVRSKGPLSNAEATRLLKELSWALAYAHAQGVVHRDIKPDNILLEAGSGRALLTDFGIAEVRRGDAGSGTGWDAGSRSGGDAGSRSGGDARSPSADREGVAALERLTEVVGTAEFMSPEQAKGAAVDGRSDLYSLAAVGFFAVSGRAPFEGGNPAEILGRHVAEPAPPLASVVPGVSPVVAAVVDRCLRKDPERRFLGGESIADALTQEAVFQRQLPVALRVFIKNLRKLAQSSNALSIVFLLFLAPALVGLVIELGIPGLWAVAGLVAAVVGAYGASAAWEARKLIKSGFGLEDARLALLEDVNRRNEELRYEVGPRKTRLDTTLEWMSVGTLGTALVAIVAIAVTDVSMSGGLGLVFGWTLGGGLTAVLVRALRAARRADLVGERWLKIWSGKVGDLLYGVGGLGLEPPKASSSIHRSTEAALGLAAARLYDELPEESKRELGNVPETVRRLEADATTLRAQVKELNAVLDELGDEPTAAGAEARDKVRRDVEATRGAAEERLREVVASLETIRVGLLRMHAGESVVHSVTMDLEVARRLVGDMEDLLEGHQEVEKLLAERRKTGTVTLGS